MSAKRVAVVLWITLCSAGMAMAQTEWVQWPGNPIIGPGDPGSWDEGGHWLSNVIFDGSIYHMSFIRHRPDHRPHRHRSCHLA